MRATFAPALSFLLSGCVAMTTSGTEESVLFNGKESSAENAQAVLKPYQDVPVSIEFKCPSKIATMTPSYVVPLPPVLPVGYAARKVSYVRIRMPESMESTMASTRVVTPQGTQMPLSDAQQSNRSSNGDGTVVTTFALDKECGALDGGLLEVAGFSYQNKDYPPAQVRLHVDSRITAGIGWWPPALFNGGHSVSGSSGDSGAPAH
ncbi:MAG TPA: hypothetical protein VEC35_25940 [Noviherbaspirillum sp.]|nr:hypothetical protein [Noviherbaspirillum sp.]